GCLLGNHPRGEGRALAAALETGRPGAGPCDHVALLIAQRDDGVIERRLDMRLSVRDVLPGFSWSTLWTATCTSHLLGILPLSGALWRSHFVQGVRRQLCGGRKCSTAAAGPAGTTWQRGLLLLRATTTATTGHRLLRTLARARVGLGPLAVHRQVAAVTQATVAADFDQALDVELDLA